MRTALVTGGAGFIGSHLASRLLSQEWKVYIVDNLSTGCEENIPDGAEFIYLDLSNDSFTSKLPSDKIDVVFHLAAQSSGEISFDDPHYDVKTNCISTIHLLEWCKKNKIMRFIYTSSMSIYGDQNVQPVKEGFIPNPKSFYGAGKLASESYLNIYSKTGINTTSLRLFNVYGPGQNMKNLRQGMVSIYMSFILKKEKVLVKGSSDRYRDFIYIDDVIDAYLSCIDQSKSFGNAYNIGTGVKTNVKELLKLELLSFGYDPINYPIKYSDPTPGDTFGIMADINAAKKDLNWKPKVSLKVGLDKMVTWVR